MTKTRMLIFSFIILLVASATIYTYSDISLDLKYYEAFKYVNTGKNIRKIIFINELDKTELANRWHIEVYFNEDGEWLKFNNIAPNNSIYEVITNNISIKSVSSQVILR